MVFVGDVFRALDGTGKRRIEGYDLLIDAFAKALVTYNTREFERVEGLMVENWA